MTSARWVPLARRLALVLGAYSLLRGLFLFHNRAIFADASAGQIVGTFLHGLRFDLSAIAMINLPFVVLIFLPFQPQPALVYQRVMKALFLVANFPFLVVNLIDVELFQFTGRRCDFNLVNLASDAGVKWTTMGLYYWPLVLLGVLIMAAFFFAYGRPSTPPDPPLKPASLWVWSANLVLAVALSVVAIRGGLQLKPITPAQAAIYNHRGLNQLALNSSFTLIKNSRKSPLKRYRFFNSDEEARQYLRPLVEGERLLSEPAARDNIVILVVESLSMEYCGAGNGGGRYTPFLDSLAGQSLFFTNHYANGRQSIEAMPSVLAGLPSLMAQSFTQSLYGDQPILGLGTLLASNGYITSFFHGAHKGTMQFDVFMRLAGIENYFGLAEYPAHADYDGMWGIFDQPYLRYVAKQLTQQKPPFAALAFTLSSHNPYTLPPQFQGRFKRGTLEIHPSIGYVDYALEQFFAVARQQPWYSNTLFIITGDHTQKLETPEYVNPLGNYRVPLLIFHPQKGFPTVDTSHVTQHVDILPSVLDYLHVQPERRLLFGRSVFRRGEGRAFLHENGHYWLVREGFALDFVPEQTSRLFDLAHDPRLTSPTTSNPDQQQKMRREAEALVQYFNNGLLDRRLYDPSDEQLSNEEGLSRIVKASKR